MYSRKSGIILIILLFLGAASSQSVVPSGPGPQYQFPSSDKVGETDHDSRTEYSPGWKIGSDSVTERNAIFVNMGSSPGHNSLDATPPGEIDVELCGKEFKFTWMGSAFEHPDSNTYASGYYYLWAGGQLSITVPSGSNPVPDQGPVKSVACSEGIHQPEIKDSEIKNNPDWSFSIQDFWVSPSKGQKRAEGKFLYLMGDTNPTLGKSRLDAFLLTDTHSKFDPIDAQNTESAYMYVEERDGTSGNEKALYKLKPGILERDGFVAFDNMISASEESLDTGNGENTWVATGSFSDGQCSDDPCELVNYRQGKDMNLKLNYRKKNITPAHSDGELYPDGEIGVGYRYYKKGSVTDSGDYISTLDQAKWSDSMKVFLCKKPNHGLVISEKKSGAGQSYICDAEEKEWSQVSACGDGIDNDNDGRIDHQDSNWKPDDVTAEKPSQCSSVTDETETRDQDCEPSVGRLNESMVNKEGLEDGKVSFYDPDPQGTYRNEENQNCLYNSYMADVPQTIDDKVEFQCHPDGSYTHPLSSDGDSLITMFEQTMWTSVNAVCSRISLFYPSGHGDSVPVSQIKYDETQLPYGPTFANAYGYNPFYFQTLPAAEEAAFGASDAHNYTAYLEKGIPASNAEPYQDPEQTSQLSDAWTIGNYMAPENPRIKGLNPIYENEVMTGYHIFKGGYAGKCPEDQPWGVYEGEKRCQPSDYKTKLDYILPDVEEETETVGLKLIQSSLLKFYLQTGSQIDKIDGACWRGLPEDRPDSIENAEDAESFVRDNIAEGSIAQTLEKVGQSLNIKVTGVPTDDPGRYTCSWSITDKNGVEYGSSDFEPYNWFEHRTGQSSAEDIIQTVQNNIESQQWPETVKENLIPSYNELDNISEIPDQVSANFFERDDIS